ncbi:MAG: Gx transporter family protein [Bacillota bacterium]
MTSSHTNFHLIKSNRTRKLTFLAMFISLAMILSVVETWIPLPVVIPGVKLGLANIITVLVILKFGYKEAIIVVFLRCLLVSMLFGGPIIFLFSISGGLFSTLVMSLLFRFFGKTFSILGISIAGSMAHNIGQIVVASIIIGEAMIFTYLPILLVAGIFTGVFVGLLSTFINNSLKKLKM